jgi:hypothetical protein
MPGYSHWTGVGRFIGQPFSAPEHLLNLALQFRGQIVRIFEVEEILPDRRFQCQSPEVQKCLIGVDEASIPVKDVSEIGDGRKRRVKDPGLAFEFFRNLS